MEVFRAGGNEVYRVVGSGGERRVLEIVATPGHTKGHVVLHDVEAGLLFSGDHVLPTITPHISGLVRADDPLKLYFESLERLHTIDGVSTVLPAHGMSFTNLHERCTAIQHHHRERLELLRVAGVDLGEASVEAYSQRLFKPIAWGPMADSETYAHLEHLVRLGQAGRPRYRGRVGGWRGDPVGRLAAAGRRGRCFRCPRCPRCLVCHPRLTSAR